MTGEMEAITTAVLGLALDAAGLRQQAIAANIANHAAQGYIPQTVNFETQMQEARRQLHSKGRIDAFALSGVRLALDPVLDAQGQPATVTLDASMVDLAQNAVHYQVLARSLNRHFAILSTAVNDGKR